MQPQNRLFGKVMKLVTGKSSVEEKENNEAENGNPEESVRLTPRGKNKLNEIELPDNLPSAKDQTTDEILPETKQKIDIQVDIKKEEME